MVRKCAYAVVAIVLDFVALCPSNAQLGFLSASGVDDCLTRANILVRQAGMTSTPTGRTERAERPPFGQARSGNGPALVSFVLVVELALAAITAAACWLVLAIAGICVSTEHRRRFKIVSPFLPERLADRAPRSMSEMPDFVSQASENPWACQMRRIR
mgnify:CR=1 FL=1